MGAKSPAVGRSGQNPRGVTGSLSLPSKTVSLISAIYNLSLQHPVRLLHDPQTLEKLPLVQRWLTLDSEPPAPPAPYPLISCSALSAAGANSTTASCRSAHSSQAQQGAVLSSFDPHRFPRLKAPLFPNTRFNPLVQQSPVELSIRMKLFYAVHFSSHQPHAATEYLKCC